VIKRGRVAFAVVAISIGAAVAAFSPPARGDLPPGMGPYMPPMTPAPSPPQTFAPLKPPFSRPEDARGISHTTPPLVPRIPIAVPPSPQLWPAAADSTAVPCSVRGGLVFLPVVVDGQLSVFALDLHASRSRFDAIDTLQIGDLRLNSVSGAPTRESLPLNADGTRARGVIGLDIISAFPFTFRQEPCSVVIFRDSAAAARTLQRQSATK
jgi:hypothetical protein